MHQKFLFPIEVAVDSLQTQKGVQYSVQFAIFYNFLMKLFLLCHDINWPNFINRLCLLPNYSVKCIPCFMLRYWPHEIWISKYLNFDFLENRKSFWSEIKNKFHKWFLLDLKKQTSKSLADITFKDSQIFFMQYSPLYISCLFSILSNAHIIDIICSPNFVADVFLDYFTSSRFFKWFYTFFKDLRSA